MKPFDAFNEQVDNVLAGFSADGNGRHALWPVRNLTRYTDIHDALFRLSSWHLYLLDPEHGEREDVRTFVIWATASHLLRLTRLGNTLETAERDVALASAYMAATPEFVAASPFARKLLPELLQMTAAQSRRDIRDPGIDLMRRAARVPSSYAKARAPDINEPLFTVHRHRTPAEFLAHPQLAAKWKQHVDALKEGRRADHAYWQDLAHGTNLVFSLESIARPAAVFASRKGQLAELHIFKDGGDFACCHVSSALRKLASIHGKVFAIPEATNNADIIKLRAFESRVADELRKNTERNEKAWNAAHTAPAPPPIPPARAPVPSIPGTTDQWLFGIAAAFLLSFLIPVLIITWPDIARTYVRAWSVALSLDPPCEPPARRLFANDLECLMPDGTLSPEAMRIPIPPHRSQP